MSEKIKTSYISTDSKDEIDLGKLIGMLLDYRWIIISIISLCLIIGIVYILFATPIYKADALVQVEPSVGNSLMSDLANVLPSAQPSSDAEIELVQSRMVLGKTVKELNLDLSIRQKYFPVIGEGWARIIGKEPAVLNINELSIPENYFNEDLIITIGNNGNYNFYDKDHKILLSGKIGELNTKNSISLQVKNTTAESGTSFIIRKTSLLSAINTLRQQLTVMDVGKDTGVLTLTLTGQDSDLIENILNEITTNYLFQNIERKSEEAEKSLIFLKTQLPQVRSALDADEDKLNQYRQQKDSVDLSLEAKSLLDSIVNIDTQLNELTFKEAEVSKLYTKEHPAYRTLIEQRQILEDEKANLNKQINAMPKTQQEILRLTRDVESGQAVYMQLLNKQQELSISKASTVGNVRIIDTAKTLPGIVRPQKLLIVLLSLIAGIIISLGYVILKSMLNKGIENPAILEQNGISVYASIPLSIWQQEKDHAIFRKDKKGNIRKEIHRELLATGNPGDLAVEAIRSLRTSLHFAMLEAKNNILMISGASPSIGKTFVCTNLAVVVAQAGKKVLVIDGDMRKGYIHNIFGLKNDNGLSDILSEQCSIEESIKATDVSDVDVITRGKVPPNPSELIMGAGFEALIESVKARYDMILIDTPPILAVTDGAIVGRHAGTSLMVARYAVNTLKEIEVSINRFNQNGVEIKGVIINSVMKKASDYYNEYGYYEYKYQSVER
ncbi:tyrosine-protein kinase Wzc [Sodalis sp. dw_96]|uniref:tyrosine-protein kinase Wzc n=1 Tax=Sodalis sp. dw_96 TaxID=2719794 RepID=UPI001BD1D362|nr:tyrosine-protein kinase Wzc [Sodalis sp. dw_96]